MPTLPMTLEPSCDTCYFFTKPTNLGGMRYCSTRHILLSTNAMTAEQKDRAYDIAAKGCTEYRKKAVGVDSFNTPAGVVSIDGVELPNKLPITTPTEARALSCLSCKLSATPAEAWDEAGISITVCKKRGLGIPYGMANKVAKQCTESVANDYAYNPAQTELAMPTLAPHLIISGDDVSAPVAAVPTVVAEVNETDKAAGIVGWKTVHDRVNPKREIQIPVFDEMFFDETERGKIPQTGDDEHPELYQDHLGLMYKCAAIWLGLSNTPALTGISGSGKTEFFRYAAWLMRLPFERISIDDATEKDDLAGKMTFTPGKGTVFEYGRIPLAWSKPCVILIDEPNVGPHEVWQFIRPLTDNSKQLVMDTNSGERIDKHKHCYFGMAMNPSWDVRNVGTHDIADADGRRLRHIFVPPASEAVERDIIRKRCDLDDYKISPAVLNTIMSTAKDLRSLAEADTLPIHWGTSQNINVALATQFFDIKDAYRLSCDFLEPQDVEKIINTVSSYQGRK